MISEGIIHSGKSGLSEQALLDLGLMGLNQRQIDDAGKILRGKTFSTCTYEAYSSAVAESILAQARWGQPCVAKVGGCMIVATRKDTIDTLAQQFVNELELASKQQRKQSKMATSQDEGRLIETLESKPNLFDPSSDFGSTVIERFAFKLDVNSLAERFDSVSKIREWELLPSSAREDAMPGLENFYYGASLNQLVREAVEAFKFKQDQRLDKKLEIISNAASKAFKTLTGPNAKWVASLAAAVCLTGKSAYHVGADPTNKSSEKRTVGLVEQTFSARLDLPYQQRIPLDVYGEGQLATVRLVNLERAEYEGAPAFRASFELYTEKGLTFFRAFGTERSQGLGRNHLTVYDVVGPNRGNIKACSAAANVALRGFALRIPGTFTR